MILFPHASMRPDTWPFSWFTTVPTLTYWPLKIDPRKLQLWRYSDPNITTWLLPNLLNYLCPFFLLLTLTLKTFFHFHCIIYPTHLQLPWWRDNQCNSLHLPVVIILYLIVIITAWLWMTRFSTEPCPLKFRFPTAKNYSGSREACIHLSFTQTSC